MSAEPYDGEKKRELGDIARDLRKEDILRADGPLNLSGNRRASPPGERRKLSESSRELLKQEVQHAEGRLEEEYQRPIEMHKEAESFLSTLPPWPAIASVVFGVLMALTAIPSSLAFHRSSWELQERQLSVMRTPEEIERHPTGQNWRAVTLMLPFAVIAVGLTIWGRRHKLAYWGLAFYVFSLAETTLMACTFEWYDGRTRTALAEKLRVECAEREVAERKRQEEQKAAQDAHQRRLAEQRAKLEEEKRQRQVADQEAARRVIYQRQLAEMEASAKAERERQLQEAERKAEDERRRKEEEERKEREAEERKLAELEQAREIRAKQLEKAERVLANQNDAHDELLKKKAKTEEDIAACEKQIEANAEEEVGLQEELEEQEGVARSCEQTIERARKRSAELAKIKAAPESRQQADEMARLATKRKALVDRDIRALKSKISALQADTKKRESEIKRYSGDVEKLDVEIEKLVNEMAETQKTIRELKD